MKNGFRESPRGDNADLGKFFRDIPLFVEAAKQRSFTRAADALGMPLSTVSRRILAMEKALGIPLFLRGARKIGLTESGRKLYERCRFIVTEADTAIEELIQEMRTPAGPVRISMPGDVYFTYLEGFMVRFAREWPDIQLYISFSERWRDLYLEPFDIDLRAGIMPDSTLRMRKLISMPTALYVSPQVLLKHPMPREPEDLPKLPCITMAQQGEVWNMVRGRVRKTVTVRAAHSVNSASVAREFALAGLGVIWMVPPMVSKYVASGELVPILPGWSIAGVEMSAVMASSQLPRRVRVFVDSMVAHFAAMSGKSPMNGL